MKKQPLQQGRERLRKTKHQFSMIPSNLRVKKRQIAKEIPSKVKNVRFDMRYLLLLLHHSTGGNYMSRKQVIVFQAIPLSTKWTTDIPRR